MITEEQAQLTISTISERAEMQIAAIEENTVQARSRLACNYAEIDQIDAAAQTTSSHLADLRKIESELVRDEATAREYAVLATDTPGAGAAIEKWQAAQNIGAQHRQTVQDEEARAAEQSQTHKERLAELHREVEEDSQQLVELDSQLLTTRRVREQAMAELGAQIYSEVKAEIEHRQQVIDGLREKQAVEQLALLNYLEQAMPRLAHWAEYQAEIRKRTLKDDARARLYAAARNYAETLLTDGPAVLSELPPWSTAFHGYGNWQQILVFPADELFVRQTLDGNPTMLRERLERLKVLYDEYRAHREKGGQ